MHLRVFTRAPAGILSENANCESYELLGGAVTRQGIKAKSSFSDLYYEAFAITLEYLDSYKSLVTHVGFGGRGERGSSFRDKYTRNRDKASPLSEYDAGVRLNDAHEFKTGWKIPAAAANAIMHVDVCVFSLLPPAVRSKARRTARTDRLYFHILPKIMFYWPTIKYAHHSFRVVKRRLMLHNGCCFNIETHISLCDKRDHLNYCEEVTFSFDL
ncbi:hypothetical protein G5I_00679 [Acromyrmex echinatior]|uniref:Uncharacterized protein n=1 Tax=Acromyrmex echinatior TaxID=103372 RepID=F4W5I2_ACREC|nr:hypothetical protein G5I_00679 [Acromyrmex echinatior]